MPTKNQKLCFVIMPFHETMKEVYWDAIKPACDKAGFEAFRVDEFEGVYNINQKIIELIFTSDAIVADLTDWRPNVFYELGVAHAIDNKTVMIIQTKNDVPFDVGAYRCIRYEQTETGLAKLSTSLVASLMSLETWRKNPTNPVQQFKPHEAFIPKSAMEAVQRELQQAKEQNVSRQSTVEAIQKELETTLAEKVTLANELKRLRAPIAPLPKKPMLRSQPLDKLSGDDVKKMLKAHNFSAPSMIGAKNGVTRRARESCINLNCSTRAKFWSITPPA